MGKNTTTTISSPKAVWKNDPQHSTLILSGNWTLTSPPISISENTGSIWPTSVITKNLTIYDSRLPAYLLKCIREKKGGEKILLSALPPNLENLLTLALQTPQQNDSKVTPPISIISLWGMYIQRLGVSSLKTMHFFGETILSIKRFIKNRKIFRKEDFWNIFQQSGVRALPIISLISFSIGMILAFVGNTQLADFGASLYVADLVGIAMVREMGVLMTAIVMSGHTGAAFAASIGSMKANQEIDALLAFGFNTFDFLVLPRVFALILIMPLLTIYANAIGIIGGMLISWVIGIPPILFYNELLTAINLENSSLGVLKSIFFGAVIAIFGCMYGINSGSSSAEVGKATTSCVVVSITSIIIFDSLFAFIFTILNI